MFVRSGDRITVSLDPRERAFLAGLPAMLDDIEDRQDPGYAVLNRDAYDDRERSEEFADLVASDRRRTRAEDRSVLAAVGDGESVLNDEQARSLLRSVNEARLVLAARSGLFDDGPGWEDRMATDPTAAAVGWLGWIQSLLIEALDNGA